MASYHNSLNWLVVGCLVDGYDDGDDDDLPKRGNPTAVLPKQRKPNQTQPA